MLPPGQSLGPTVLRGKFCQIPRLTTAKLFKFRGLPRPSVCEWTELYSVRELQLLKDGVVLSYPNKIQRKLTIFVFKSAICQIELCLFIIVCCIVMAIRRAHSFRQVSLIIFVILLVYLVTLWSRRSYWSLIISQFLQNSVKFHGNIKIPWKRANSAAQLEIPQPAENYMQ